MSIINGSLDRRTALLSSCNLTGNPFTRTEPSEEVIDRVFVGRVQQIREAAFRVLDRPRNLLVLGGYGLGKTTFIRKLLRELQSSRTIRFLTGYAPLRSDTSQGLQLAALSALAEGALQSAPTDSDLYRYAREVWEELGRIEGSASETMRAPDIRFREGLKLANGMFKRVVIAIDEIDKRDPQTVQSIVMGSRYFLDLEASFILTGRFLDAFSDIRASLLAAFDHRIELQPFVPEECEEILRRNLQIVRVEEEPTPTLRPFQREVVEAITQRANGLPRPLNLMADGALEEAIWEAVEDKTTTLEVTSEHLERALRREGNLVFNKVGAEARELLARIFRQNGYVTGGDLDTLAPMGGLPEAIRTLEDLSKQDAVLRLGASEGPAFALTPMVERTLEQLQKDHERLQALWKMRPPRRTPIHVGGPSRSSPRHSSGWPSRWSSATHERIPRNWTFSSSVQPIRMSASTTRTSSWSARTGGASRWTSVSSRSCWARCRRATGPRPSCSRAVSSPRMRDSRQPMPSPPPRRRSCCSQGRRSRPSCPR
jgi:type II secretory pathway predicted ATPase ExeA